MNVASKDLCQELYELSGWITYQYGWLDTPDGAVLISGWEPVSEGGAIPAYDLGYLLRKLESISRPGMYRLANVQLVRQDDNWRCGFKGVQYATAAEPEDAATKIAIELFKQGILKRGSDV